MCVGWGVFIRVHACERVYVSVFMSVRLQIVTPQYSYDRTCIDEDSTSITRMCAAVAIRWKNVDATGTIRTAAKLHDLVTSSIALL
jgi:hypothetical protein